MPQSLADVHLHLIFSTAGRTPWLTPDIRPRVHAYLATVARNAGCEAYRVGGIADHVHLALQFSRTLSIAALVQELKTASSKWIKPLDPTVQHFGWQSGYGIFSVSRSKLTALLAYIDRQEEHHRTQTFQEEYRSFLQKYGVPFDERYVWD